MKPIKRSEALKQLSKDHHFNLLFIWKIRQGLKLNVELLRIQKFIAHFFNEQILHHFSVEEKYLFCLLSREDLLRIRAEQEHLAIKRSFEKMSGDSITKNEVIEFTNLLESHIRFEERTLFNHMEKDMPGKLQQAAKYFSSEHLEDGWPDTFWLKPK
jgi:hemerythrin-like domain-containing protein